MDKIGIFGGGLLCEVAFLHEVDSFFNCICEFAIPAHPEKQWHLITDRLYRRYVRIEDSESTMELMGLVRHIFNNTESTRVHAATVFADSKMCSLDWNSATFGEVFQKFFECFNDCVESMNITFSRFDTYRPVRIMSADLGIFLTHRDLPLEFLEQIRANENPIWKRKLSST